MEMSVQDQFTDNKKMRIVNLLLQETGTYNSMYIRPYITHVTQEASNIIADRVEQTGDISPSTFAGLTGNMITPSSVNLGEIPIPGGWNHKRISFLLTLEVSSTMISNKLIYVQGYTDHLGIANSGAIDPRMLFFINSITAVARNTVQTPMGVQCMDRVIETAQVINGQLFVDRSYSDNGVYGLRPYDIFVSTQIAGISDIGHNYNNIYDKRVRLDSSPNLSKSSRKNNIPTSYMSTLIGSYKNALSLSEFGGIDSDVYSRAASLSSDHSVLNNEFIRAIEMYTGISSPVTFNINILESIDPNVGNVTNFIRVGNTMLVGCHTAGNSEHWNGANRETVIATLLSNAIPSLMLEYMINKITFRSTNHDINGQPTTVLIDAKSVTNLDLTKSFSMFKHRLENELIYDITFGNQISYMLDVQCDVFGESRIGLSLDGGPMISYVTPSFCDSLITPVYTTNKDMLYTVCHDIEHIFSNIGSSTHTQQHVNSII